MLSHGRHEGAGSFPSIADADAFPWLRAFPPAADREALKESSMRGRNDGPVRAAADAVLEDHASVLVEDHEDLWLRWRPEAR